MATGNRLSTEIMINLAGNLTAKNIIALADALGADVRFLI